MKSADLHRHFWRNRKARSLTDAEHRIYTSLIAYCADQENDGRVTIDDLADVCTQQGHAGREREIAAGLASKRALDPCDDGSWLVHGWLEHQPSVEQLEARREAMVELASRGGQAKTEAKRAAARAREAAKAEARATAQARACDTAQADAQADASADALGPAQADHNRTARAGAQADHKRDHNPPALPCPARPGPLGAGGRAVGVDRTTPAPPTAPPSSAGPQRAPSSGGARQAEVRGEGFVPPVLRGRALTLTETVARAELLDPSRMARTRDGGGDVEAEACRILADHAASHATPTAPAQLDRTAASSAIADLKRRALAKATSAAAAPPHDDDPDERRAIAGENGDFDLDAPGKAGEDGA